MPEMLNIVRQQRVLGVSFFNGAIVDIPYIFRMEMLATLEAESEYESIRLINLKLKAQRYEDTAEQQ